MSKGAAGHSQHRHKKDRKCPRDQHLMKHVTAGECVLDVCRACGGQVFDTGEMFAPFGVKPDPAHWDRPETGGVVKDGTLHCPQCDKFMLVQDVTYSGEHV